jgi:hypothetical protein
MNYLWAVALSMPADMMNRFHNAYTLARHRMKHGKRKKSFSILYLIILLLRDARVLVSMDKKKGSSPFPVGEFSQKYHQNSIKSLV